MSTAIAVPGKSRMPPPLPNLAGLIIGLLIGWLVPWPIGAYSLVLPAGLALTGVVVWLSVSMALAFKRHGTPPDPAEETTAIIDTGPFKFSRNPAYLTVALLQIALGLLFNNGWIVLLTLPAATIVNYVVVTKEEAYLEGKFGAEYLRYKARVRRWL
jgi:protein-S-isoprenylcysteine O-methyltransferase Ste14